MRRRSSKAVTKKLPTQRELISSLKSIYQLFAAPFAKADYDSACNPKYKSNIVIKVFGSWEDGIAKAGLSKKFQSHQIVINEKDDFDPEKEIKQNWKKEKERLLDRAEKRRIKWLKDQTHKIDLLKEMLDEAIAKADPVVVKVTPPKKQTRAKAVLPPATLWFEFSDLQLGTLITKEEMGGINEHNWLIWQHKLQIWKQEVLLKIESYKKLYTIDQVIIACLGDMVEGQDIFRGQVWKVDRHVVDQAIQGANDTAVCFAEIMLAHPELKFDLLEVFGNHGRIGHKGDLPYACSMDKVYQRMLQSQLKGIKELKNYQYHHNEVWFSFIEIYGWNHLLLHGDQGMSKMWSGRPTVNGLEKGLVRYNQMFQNQVHFLHCGHFHSPVNWSFNVSQILINGSFIGTSDYSATKMVASSPPVQLMYVFTPRVGLDITHRIYLSDESVKKAITPKSLEGGRL
jgi:hypothetical protein